jgi:glyoxylase I family protein
MSNISLHHVALRCRNLAAQEAFYTRHFGFKRSATLNRGQPNEFFLLKLGSVRLEFFPPEAASEQARGGEQAVGFRHLAFEVPKLEPLLEALKADGIQPDPIIEIAERNLRIVFFRDPEGNIIELVEGALDEV